MDERVIFHTEFGVGISSVHPQTLGIQYLLKQSSNSSSNCQSYEKDMIFVSFKDKAILNSYKVPKLHTANKSGEIPVHQRLTTMEPLSNILLIKDTYLIGTAAKPGRTLVYIYDITSGSLINTIPMGKVHYMGVDKLKYIEERGYIVTISSDGRFALWNITGLLSGEAMPAYVFNEHQGVSVNDVSWDGSESVLFSCGEDGTVCCYNFVSNVVDELIKDKENKTKEASAEGSIDRIVLVSRFTLPQSVIQIELDSSSRFAVCVLKNGELWELPLIYQLGKGKIANLHSLTMQGSSSNTSVALYNCALEEDLDMNNESLFNLLRRGIISCRIIAKGCRSIKLTLDSATILMGRKRLGHSCLVVDLNTSQVIKDVGTPLGLNVREENSDGIIVDYVWCASLDREEKENHFITLPNLSKVTEDSHIINVLNNSNTKADRNILLEEFDIYIKEKVIDVAHVFANATFDETHENSKDSEIFTARAKNSSSVAENDTKDKEIHDLKEQVERLREAYAELKEMV